MSDAPTRRRPEGYSLIQIWLHWVIAALVIFQLLVHDGMEDAYDARMDGRAVEDAGWAILHVVVGVAVLLLAVVRVVVRWRRGGPGSPPDNPRILNWFGYVAHVLLYLFIFAMPLTGAIAWFGGIEASAELHEFGRLILIPLIALHAAGALFEQFVMRNDVLVRMLKPERR